MSLAAVSEAHHSWAALLWAVALVTVYGGRIWFGHQFTSQSAQQQQADTRRWRLRAVVAATLSGLVWGPGTFMLWRLADDRERVFVVAVLSGLLAAVASLLAALRPAFVGFVTPVWAGLLASLVSTASTATEVAMAAMTVVLLPLLLRATRTMHDEFERTTALMLAQEQLTLDLEATRDAAVAAARARSDFVSMMSHELRTPLNGVVGLTTLLLDTELNADQKQLATGAHASAEMLMSLINGVLDLSKIDAGKLELDNAAFDLPRELRALGAVLAMRAREKELGFSIDIEGQVPASLWGDWFRLRQVLVNLVGNALKFTERGDVSVSLVMQAATPTQVTARFEVKDTGIGMTAEQLARVFQPFAQAAPSTARRFGGSGLGLSISERLVTLMGGTLTVDSAEGRGSTFSFSVPLEVRATAGAPHLPLAAGLRSGRVAVCDDNDVNLTVAARLVERLGFEVERARDGVELLALMEARPCDVVLLDLQMPGLDGYDTLTRLRATGRLIAVAALTASASVVERDRCLAAGFDAFLTKPLNVAELTLTLDRLRQLTPSGLAH